MQQHGQGFFGVKRYQEGTRAERAILPEEHVLIPCFAPLSIPFSAEAKKREIIALELNVYALALQGLFSRRFSRDLRFASIC